MPIVKIKKLHKDAVVPKFAKPGDAGADLVATEKFIDVTNNVLTFKLGIAAEIPDGHEVQLRPRSSIYKTGLMMCNTPGTIDSGYRGEWMVKFYIIPGAGSETYDIGDRVCQAVLTKTEETEYVEVEVLDETERGAGGFGSSGK